MLDDPFGGGKALLAQAGIAVVRRKEWERDYLGLVMDFYARYPEFCAFRQFGQALAAWQRHQPLGRDEWVKAVFLRHLAAYLPIVPKARQEEIRRSFFAQVDDLVGVTLAECAGIPTVAFIAKLHRALFPPGFRHRAVGNDGRESETASGEWLRHDLWPHYIAFSAPETIERYLAALLDRLSAKAAWQRADALQFFLEFLSIYPFTDANGRLAAILADVICLNFGLAPLAVDIKNPLFKTAFWEDVHGGAAVESQLRLMDGWNRGELGIKPRSFSETVAIQKPLSPDSRMTFDETIEASLRPRLLDTLGKRPKHEYERLISNFRGHVRLLSAYLREELCDGKLSINTAIGFHIRLYPPGHLIDAMDNHGSPDKPGNPVKISPGAWRQREVRDEPFRRLRWRSICSPLLCIERDLEQTFSALNAITNPRREDICRFYFSFLRVHPFADSNGTTSAVPADALCAYHGLALALNVRFNLETSVERAGVCGFPGAWQGATTRNGSSIPRSCNAAMRPENRAIQPVALSPHG